MTLIEVLDRAAGMDPLDRGRRFTICGNHDRVELSRASSSAVESEPYFCPVCLTVFSASGFQMWNPPADAE